MQAHKHTHAEKHKQRLSLEARLAEAETGADGLFGGAVAGSSERFDCFQASRRNMTVCVWQGASKDLHIIVSILSASHTMSWRRLHRNTKFWMLVKDTRPRSNR